MTLDDVVGLIRYLNLHPTAAEILALVHEVKPKGLSGRKVSQDEFNRNLPEAMQYLDGKPQKVTDDIAEGIAWAEEQMKKLKIN